MDYQIKLDGEVDLLDAEKRLQKIKEEQRQEQQGKQLNLFEDNEGRC